MWQARRRTNGTADWGVLEMSPGPAARTAAKWESGSGKVWERVMGSFVDPVEDSRFCLRGNEKLLNALYEGT